MDALRSGDGPASDSGNVQDGDKAQPVGSNCVALTLLVATPDFAGRAHELLARVFDHYPDREWLIVALPSDLAPQRALRTFQCLSPRPGSLYPQNLYIMHRCAAYLINMSLHCSQGPCVTAPTKLLRGSLQLAQVCARAHCTSSAMPVDSASPLDVLFTSTLAGTDS